MSERVSQIIAAGAARPRPNGIFAADCPLHEGKETKVCFRLVQLGFLFLVAMKSY
jgi:hypothetical protein